MAQDGAEAACDPGIVSFPGADGTATAYAVELALTPEEQARGLMFRRSMAPDAGMLFVFDPPRPAAFWMRNTFISLDILFIDDTGRVANIAARTTPFSEESLPSDGAVRAVLEIVGGSAEAAGIAAGSQAVHPAFEQAPAPYRCAS